MKVGGRRGRTGVGGFAWGQGDYPISPLNVYFVGPNLGFALEKRANLKFAPTVQRAFDGNSVLMEAIIGYSHILDLRKISQ